MISSISFCYLVHEIICEEKSDYYMKLIAVNIFQLITEMYLITFLANMIIYLSYEFIIQYFISESNLIIKHAEKIIIIKIFFCIFNKWNFCLIFLIMILIIKILEKQNTSFNNIIQKTRFQIYFKIKKTRSSQFSSFIIENMLSHWFITAIH